MPASLMLLSYPRNQLLAFGVNLSGKPVPVVNVPEGCTVARIRWRASDFTTVFLRRGKTFEQWHCNWADEEHTGLTLLCPIARNERRAGYSVQVPIPISQ